MQAGTRLKLRRALVWLCRAVCGLTFAVSGWSKAIDPWGFLIKTNEYLSVWGLDLPRELVLTCCIGLAAVEFVTGVLLMTGSLKRASSVVALAMMSFMLPLTAYIALYNPVSDCGCFGDFFVISNGATFWKNIALTAMIVYLTITNRTVRGLYAAPIQWLVVAVSVAFPLSLSFIGYNIQPLVDFRPYKTGTELFGEVSDADASVVYVYEKEGRRQEFSLSALPDSTWTFVDVIEPAELIGGFAVNDADGDDVSPSLAEMTGGVLYLLVAEPGVQFLSRAHYVNRLHEYAASKGIAMIGIAGAEGESLLEWTALARPHFPVYSAEDTALQQLARGDAALVYVKDGIIMWKRNLTGMAPLLPDRQGYENALESVMPVDDGRAHAIAVALYVAAMCIIYLLSLSPKILRLFVSHTKKND